MVKNLFIKLCCAILMTTVSIRMVAGEEDRVFMSYDASNGLADNSVQIARCTRTGRVMISTIGHVNFYDGYSFNHIDPTASDVKALPQYQGDYQLFFDKFHHLWGKNRGGMTCVDLLTERFIRDVDGALRLMGEDTHIDDFYGDGECNMWFRRGNRLSSGILQKQFDLHAKATLQDVDLYNDSLLLLFHADGSVAVYDYKNPRFLYRDEAFKDEADRKGYAKSAILCLVGSQYFQIRNGSNSAVLMRYDIQKRQWTRLLETPFQMNDLYPVDHQIYIASERGYLIYDIQQEKAQHYETLKLTKGRTMIPDVNTLTFDRQGGLWLGTAKRGLLYCKAHHSPFKVYPVNAPEVQKYVHQFDEQEQADSSLPYKVNCVLTDSRGWKWTGTFSGLDVKFKDGRKRHLTRKDGLINEVVHAMVEDDNHDIWVSASYGVMHVYVRGDSIYHIESYINQDNIPNESFINRRAMKLEDGTIVMQTLDHVLMFNPASFQGEHLGSIVLYPKLIRLLVNGNSIEPGTLLDGKVILERSITRTREFHVNYNQNSLSLTFSGLNYLRPIQTYYRVRVKGVPAFDDWRVLSFGKSGGLVDRNGMLRLSLLGLEPGKYVVELQASLWVDIWPQEPFTWIIHVDQPWWRSTGIYVLFFLLLLTAVLVNLRLFRRNTRLRMKCLNEEEDMLLRLRSVADRLEELRTEVLTPQSNMLDADSNPEAEAFERVMLVLVPYVQQHHSERFTLRQLASEVEMDKIELFELLAYHVDRNPRLLMGKLRLQEAARLLRTTDMPIEDVAEACGFVTPNYFVTAFYRLYHVNPLHYRKSNAL